MVIYLREWGFLGEMNALEIKENLKKEYPYKVEMHAHTKGISGCSFITPEEMAQTYADAEYTGVMITNHFSLSKGREKEEYLDWYINGYEETKKAAEKYGLNVYLGAEIRFTEASHDYLVVGADRKVLNVCYDFLDKGIETFKSEADLPDTLIVQAHPFRDNRPIGPDCVDGIEVYNMHPNHNSRPGLASQFAKENGIKIITAGSDYHDKGWGALCSVRFKKIPADSFDIAKLLKSGDYILEVGDDIIIP